jgi:hypothetical protein
VGNVVDIELDIAVINRVTENLRQE